MTPPVSLGMDSASEPQLPPHLQTLLDEWHSENGNKFPPCGNVITRSAIKPSKGFDRQGNSLKIDIIELSVPCKYKVTVLHPLDSPPQLVGPLFPFASNSCSYLRIWRGAVLGYEINCCALRQFGETEDDIVYNPEAWARLDILLERAQDNRASTADESPGVQTRRRRKEMASRIMQRQQGRPRKARAIRARVQSVESEESSYGEDDSDDSEEEARPAKKVKPEEKTDEGLLTTHPNLVFKLISFKSGAIRRFPLEECKTGKELFEKARYFYKLFDKNIEVKVLSCQIPSEREQHYLFEGSEGEFGLLINHVKSMGLNPLDPLTIEIGHVAEQ